jgi:signal transduction histidine kinase/ActR/RegA family two-component response regulator
VIAWFRRQPIRSKLVAMLMTISVVVLALASAGHLYTDYKNLRADAESDLRGQAEIILASAGAAIQFDRADEADATLKAFGSNPDVRSACLYDEVDELFAEYKQTPDATGCNPMGPVIAPSTSTRILLAVHSVDSSNGRKIGTLTLRSSLAVVERRLREQMVIIGVVILISLGVATLLSARLHRFISDPVIALARTASDVSQRGDYSLRAERRTDDELGVLADAFNRMLERIQTRETELSRANDDLRREVVERRRAEQERAELLVREREANRLKDEFLATLSHELRTPLNAILGWTKLLRTKALPPDATDRALEKVERNAQAQARLVEDLLEVSRITTGKLRLEVRPFDLVALAHTALESLRLAAEARGVTIEREFAEASLPTAGDPDRLQQVMWNLLSNAVKFTPSGGRVTFVLRRRGEVDEMIVSDTGIGIDPSFLPNVFDSFRQADATATRAHGGLGLGLSIVSHLVDIHGGTVAASSGGRDQGATFTVRLPVRDARRETSPPAAVPLADGLLRGFTIVAVDDDPDTRELLQSVLDNAGARVHAAGSVEEALALCHLERPDAIVSDIGMPGRDGYSLMRDLHDQLGPSGPRVAVALSAYAAPADRERSLAAGFQWHVAKPFDAVNLVHALHALLNDEAPAAGR